MSEHETETAESENGEKKTRKIADHKYVDADGNEVSIEKATGASYRDVKTGQEIVTQIPDLVPGTALAMYALFGCRTKYTNDASRNRQNSDSDQTDVEYITTVRDKILGGDWPERTGGGGGRRKYDLQVLAGALVQTLGKGAKGDVSDYAERLESESGYQAKVTSNARVMQAYHAALAKVKPETALDSLA